MASRAQSLQVVAANKMTRPNLDDESIQMFKTGPNDTGSSGVPDRPPYQAYRESYRAPARQQEGLRMPEGLRILLGQRSRLMKYLMKKDRAEYERVMDGLNLRIKSA